jgi:hypothetical protein
VERTLRLRYDDGTSIGEVRVDVFGQKGREFSGFTNGRGEVEFEWDDDWIDRVEVDRVVVKREWSFSYGNRELDLAIPAPLSGSSFVPKSAPTEDKRVTESLFAFRDPNGQPLAGRQIVLHGAGGERYSGRTGSDGVLRIAVATDYLERVEVDGAVVKRDWSLSGLFGPKTEFEIEVGQGEAKTIDYGGGGDERVLRVRYRDGAPVVGKEVSVYDSLDRGLRLTTDQDGRVRFHWREDYIKLVEIEQLPVKRDWSVQGMFGPMTELELEVPRPTGGRLEERDNLRRADHDYTDSGVRGRLFYHDGTQVKEKFKVAVSFRGNAGTYDTEQPRSYCQDNGEFFIATNEYEKGTVAQRMWIKSDELHSSRWLRDSATGYYVVLIPKGWGRGGGDKGGVIAGEVVDRDGSPRPNARLRAVVRGASFLSGSPEVETYSDDQGRFILIFEGGISLKTLYVDGNEPLAVFQGEGKDAVRIDPHNIAAGSFGLLVVRPAGVFG